MKVLGSNDGSYFYLVEPKLFDDDMELISVHFEEKLYGDIATFDIKCRTDKELISIGKKITAKLITQYGYCNDIQGYVYSIKYIHNDMIINIICCDPKFTIGKAVTKYTSIDNAIKSTYSLPRLDKPPVKTDLMKFSDPWYIYQKNETNYSLCKKLCMSYKHNTVFGFLLSGLKFKDLKNWIPEIVTTDQAEINLVDSPLFNNPKLYDESVDYAEYNTDAPDMENEIDPNHKKVIMYSEIQTVNNVYEDLIGNYLFNKRLSISKNTNNFKIHYLPDWQVGDFIKINSNQLKFKECFISSRIIDYTRASVDVSLTIQSINPL